MPFRLAKRKRVLMVVESFARGGVERQILALIEGLLPRGYQVRIFQLIGVAPGQSNFEAELAQLGIPLWNPATLGPLYREPPGSCSLAELAQFAALLPGNFHALGRALELTIKDFEPGVVNGWSDVANLIGGFVAKATDVPRIVIGQRVLPPSSADSRSSLYRVAYRDLADDPRVAFINSSATSAREYERWLGLDPGAVKVVYCGLSPSHLEIGKAAAQASFRMAFGLPNGGLVVGGLMRFAPEKDPRLWIETAAAIAAARPDTAFLLGGYGHGRIAQELFEEAARLGFADRLVMPGAITDLRRFYGALDVFLLTSRSENLGNVMIEAQAAGVPVIGPAVGGIGETMHDGVTGHLVTDRSAQSLAAAVLCVLADDAWRKRSETAGPAFVARKFGHRRMVDETEAVYRNSRVRAALGRIRNGWVRSGGDGADRY